MNWKLSSFSRKRSSADPSRRQRGRRGKARDDRATPRFEALEDRTVPTTLPAGFVETLVTTNSNISGGTAMEFSPTGQLWALEQTGAVKVVRADGTTATTLTLTV